MQSNQRRLVRDHDASRSFDELLALVGRRIRQLERNRIVALIGSDPLWGQLDDFRFIPPPESVTIPRWTVSSG